MKIKVGDIIHWNRGDIDKIISIDGNDAVVQILFDSIDNISHGHPYETLRFKITSLHDDVFKILTDEEYFTLVMER